MAQPWFSDPTAFGTMYGAVAGSLCGVFGGIWGTAAGFLAPRGKGRPWILGSALLAIVFGVLNLLVGLTALLTGQPNAIWQPFLMIGSIMTLVMGLNYPMLLRRYQDSEERRIDAQSLRTG
jgi:hypothetical protein